MKKILVLFMSLLIFTGCDTNMGNTPTKAVEDFLGKYQTNDSDVISDLNDVLASLIDLTDKDQDNYREFMKKHYQDMQYTIKDETIDGDKATVETEITVRNYADAYNNAEEYYMNHKDEFNDKSYAEYRLNKLKEVTNMETYTIDFKLTKEDGKWTVDDLSDEQESKLNGFYGAKNYSEISLDEGNETNSDSNDNSDENMDDRVTDSMDGNNEDATEGNQTVTNP